MIDYEYSNWNPLTYDLGNFLNEYCCDNAHPEGSGTRHYPENMPSDDQIEYLVRCYFECSMEGSKPEDVETAWLQKKDNLIKMTQNCMLLNNFYWTAWCFMMMQQEDYANPENFTWEFLVGRMALIKSQYERFGHPTS